MLFSQSAGSERSTDDAIKMKLDRVVGIECEDTSGSSNGGLLLLRKLDLQLGLSEIASEILTDSRSNTKKNMVHEFEALYAQSIYTRMAGYEDVNDADHLADDPVLREVVGGQAIDQRAASSSQMSRFETEMLTLPENREPLKRLNGKWVDRYHDYQKNKLESIILDMDSSVSETYGKQEGAVWNNHYKCKGYNPNFLFNQLGMIEGAVLRNGNVSSAHDWQELLVPAIERYAKRGVPIYLRADAGYATPELYDMMEDVKGFYAIRLKSNAVLARQISDLTDQQMRCSLSAPMKRVYRDFMYQAKSWREPRRVIAKVEWHPGDLFARVGFIVTNLSREPEQVVQFYNQRGTAEQHIKEAKYAFKMTRLSCQGFKENQARLQLHTLAYNVVNFLRCLELPEEMNRWSLSSLQLNLIKTKARLVRHARMVTFKFAKSLAVTNQVLGAILAAIDRLRAPPPPPTPSAT